jgi:hypothetical protein
MYLEEQKEKNISYLSQRYSIVVFSVKKFNNFWDFLDVTTFLM